jgi:hypothetical protein
LIPGCGQTPANDRPDLARATDAAIDFSSLPDLSMRSDLSTSPPVDQSAPADLAMACDPQTRWPQMLKEAIAPPGKAAGLDVVGANGQGLTVAQAQQIDCAGVPDGDQFGDGSQVIAWGDNKEVWLDYDPNSQRGIQLNVWPGYLGSATFASPNGLHGYAIPVGQPITRDGAVFALDWTGNNGQTFESQADELYRALIHTFAPTIPQAAPGVTCLAAKTCLKGLFGNTGYFDIPALGLTLFVDDVTLPPPGPSAPTEIALSLPR